MYRLNSFMADFDQQSEWDLDEELTDDLAEFDDFDEQYEVIATRTAVMQKSE